MSDIRTKIKIEDDASEKLFKIADAVMSLTERFDTLADKASGQFDRVSTVIDNAAKNADRISNSFGKTQADMSEVSRAADKAADSFSKFESASDSVDELGKSASELEENTKKVSDALSLAAEKHRKKAEAAQIENDIARQSLEIHRSSYDAYLKEIESVEKLSVEQEKEKSQYEKLIQAAERSVETTQRNADKLKAEAEAAEQMASKAAKADEKIKGLGETSKSTGDKVKEFGDESEQAGEKSESFGKKTESASESLSKLLVAAGGYKVLQLVKNAFEETAQAGIEYESAMTGVFKTVDGTQEQLDGISKAVREMALDMPSDVTEIAGVMENAGQLGIATDSVAEFSKVMIDLGNSTNLTAEQAATSLAKFANITGMSAQDYDRLGSVVVDLGNSFATTESDIVNMSTYLTSAASVAGFAETDILALAAAMSSVGINAEAGGSSMSKLISKMQSAVEIGGGDLEAFAEVAGMTAQEFKKAFEVDGVGALQAFILGLNDVERNGRSMSVVLSDMKLDDIRMSNTLKALAQGNDVLTSAVAKANTAWNENVALTNEADKRYGTLDSKIQMAKNAANDLQISIGNTLTPTISALTDKLTGALEAMSGFAEESPTVTSGIMGAVGAVGSAIGGFTTLAPAITAVSTAFQAFDKTLSFSKIGIIIGVIAAAGAAIGAITYAISSAEDAVEDYDGTLEECSKEIDSVSAAHEKAVQMYGAESDAAKELGKQLETLEAQYKKGGGVAEDMAQRLSESEKAFGDFKKKYNDSIKSIEDTATAGLITAAQLQTLADKTNKTNGDLELMGQYADYLNDTFECTIKVNYDTGELTGFDPYEQFQNDLNTKIDEKKRTTAIESLSDTDFRTEYVNDLKNLNTTERSIAYYRQRLASEIEYMDKVKGIGFAKQFPSSDPNERYDFTAMMGELGRADEGYGVNPYQDNGWSLFNPNYVSTQEELEQFYSDYRTLQNLLNTKSGYESQIGEKNSTIKDLYSTAGMSGGESSYIKDLNKAANDTGNSIKSLADYMKIYKNGTNDALGAQIDFEKLLDTTSEKAKETGFTLDELGKAFYRAVSDGELSMEEMVDLASQLPEEAQEPLKEYMDTVALLGEEYEKTSEAISQAFDGQFSLLERVKESTGATLEALDTSASEQLSHWESYVKGIEQMSQISAESLNVAKEDMAAFELGFDVLKQKFSDGSAESVQLMNEIGYNISHGGEESVKDVILKLGQVEQERSKAKEDTADFVTDIDQKMGEAYDKAKESIDKLDDLPRPANEAALKIMNDFRKGIELGGRAAITQAAEVAKGISEALSNVTVPTISAPKINSYSDYKRYVEGNAEGTTNSADVFIAGEEGPELIVGKGGSTVFPTSETEKIINAVGGLQGSVSGTFRKDSIFIPEKMNVTDELTDRIESIFIPVMGKTVDIIGSAVSRITESEDVKSNVIVLPEHESGQSGNSTGTDGSSVRDKHITIDIGGSGHIEVSNGADKSSVLEVLQENLKPVLMNIIEQEVYEEGDESYEY